MTKLSYSAKTRQFIVSELGRIVDSDSDFDALASRNGFVSNEQSNTSEVESVNESKEKQ